MSEARTRDVLGLVEVAALVLTIGAGLVAGSAGIAWRRYDYDEDQRAHSVWLASQGLRPYSDFFECHPPYFRLLTPVLRLGGADPTDSVLALRIFGAAGTLVFLGALATLGARGAAPGAGLRGAWLGVAVVAVSPPLLDAFVEFRIDGWGYALAAWSFVRFLRRDRGSARFVELGALTGIAAALFCPKLVLLPPLIVLFDRLGAGESPRASLRAGAAFVAGAGLAAGLLALYLVANRIDFGRTILLVGRYNALSNAQSAFGYGLAGRLVLFWPVTLLVVAGAAAWGVDQVRGRRRSAPYERALAVWLVLQALLVSYPFKQYYAPWFLFGTGFTAYLGRVVGGLRRDVRALVFVLACAPSVFHAGWMTWGWSRDRVAGPERDLIRWMNRVAAPSDRVVAPPPIHPIARRDTFFLWFVTGDPKGFDSERILAGLPGMESSVTEDHYRAELEAHPPAFVVLGNGPDHVFYTEGQRATLSVFLHERHYRIARVGPATLLIRPDRFDYALRNGLLP